MSELITIPDAAVVGMIASRAWQDWSAVSRITAALLARGTDLRLGGCQALQDRAMTVALSLLEASDLDVRCRAYTTALDQGGVAGRNARFLEHLANRQESRGDAHLVAFLALDAKGQPGQTHWLTDEARKRGIPVTVIDPGPDTEPAVGVQLGETAERALDHIERADGAFRQTTPVRFALYRVAMSAAERLVPEAEAVERRLASQWGWLDANPLVVDFAVREYRTLSLLATYSLLQRVQGAAARLVREHAHEAEWTPAFGREAVAS